MSMEASLPITKASSYSDLCISGYLKNATTGRYGAEGRPKTIRILESGLHWYLKYLDYHVVKLGMTKPQTYPCF